MKKTLLILAVVLAGSLFTNSAKAQDSKVLAGAGISYLTEIGTVGLSINGVYLFDETWEGAVTYTHAFEKDMISWNIFNFDAHYIFSTGEKTKAYGIAGLNYTSMNWNFPEVKGFSLDESSTSVGVDLGVGMRYSISDKMSLNGELKYATATTGYVNVGVGVLYSF